MNEILVVGFYKASKNGNLGDELFKESFQTLFPNYRFTFSEKASLDDLKNKKAVIFGGGSFLDGKPMVSQECLTALLTGILPIFYIGIGVSSNIHPDHVNLIRLAKLIVVRSENCLSLVQSHNNNAIFCPDIVFSCNYKINKNKNNKILFIPNIEVIPEYDSPHWKHVAWESFKNETAQAIDELNNSGYYFDFLPFSFMEKKPDIFAASEILARTKNKIAGNNILYNIDSSLNAAQVTNLISSYKLVISQRFHGLVLSDLVGAPYLSIYHHDKLKTFNLNFPSISYYCFDKALLLNLVKENLNKDYRQSPDYSQYFDRIRESVKRLID